LFIQKVLTAKALSDGYSLQALECNYKMLSKLITCMNIVGTFHWNAVRIVS
jgi:hypothetical protein